MALAVAEAPTDRGTDEAARPPAAARPTAGNLAWALAEMRRALAELPPERRLAAALARAGAIAEEDVAINRAIGEHGMKLIEGALQAKGGRAPVQAPTHCNAACLAPRRLGTPLAPTSRPHDAEL